MFIAFYLGQIFAEFSSCSYFCVNVDFFNGFVILTFVPTIHFCPVKTQVSITSLISVCLALTSFALLWQKLIPTKSKQDYLISWFLCALNGPLHQCYMTVDVIFFSAKVFQEL